jgi:hypothetical protein
MRPTVSEQLDGIGRILREVVLPVVDDAYAADVLVGVLATVETLASGWADVPAYLAWDAQRTLDLLAAASALDERHRAALTAVLADPPADPTDLRALERHHARVRALLADVAAAGTAPDEVSAHMRERAERYPLAVAQRMPGQR